MTDKTIETGTKKAKIMLAAITKQVV